MTQWQYVWMSIDAGLDASRVARWDHRTGYLSTPERRWSYNSLCRFEYPKDPEGEGYGARLAIQGTEVVDAPPHVRRGGWYDVIVQWLPDGRCAGMLDGQLLGVTPSASVGDHARVVMWGSSVNTAILVGGMEVWSGVHPDIAQALARRNE